MGGFLENLLAIGAPSSLKAWQGLQDSDQYSTDLAQFAKDPTYRLDPSKYKDVANAVAVDAHLKGLRDNALQNQAAPVLEQFAADYANLAGPDKRFFADPASVEELKRGGLQVPDATNNPFLRKGLQDFRQQGQLESDMGDVLANPENIGALARVASNPLAQAQHNILNTLQVSQDKALMRADAQAKEDRAAQKAQDVSDFQSAVAGLTGRSKSPLDLARFAQRGGYDTFPGVESDIRQAAAAYGVGDSAEVDKAIDNARGAYKDTYLPTESGKVGRTSYTGQRNLMGDFRKDAQSTAPVTNITVQGNKGRTAEFSLRKEFLSLPEVKDYPTVESSLKRATVALREQGKGSNVAVDQTIITVLNKMLDHTSVVRESEYARTPQDLAVLSRIKGKFDKLASGGAGLTPEERQALNRMVTNFGTIASQQYNARVKEYRKLAGDYGLNADRVVVRANGVEVEGGLQSAAAAELARRKGGK